MPFEIIGSAKFPSHSKVSNVAGMEIGGSFGLGSTTMRAVAGVAVGVLTGSAVVGVAVGVLTGTTICDGGDGNFGGATACIALVSILGRVGEPLRGTGEPQPVLSEHKLSLVRILYRNAPLPTDSLQVDPASEEHSDIMLPANLRATIGRVLAGDSAGALLPGVDDRLSTTALLLACRTLRPADMLLPDVGKVTVELALVTGAAR